MANRLDYYFRQKVTEAELDLGFNYLEVADRALATDNAHTGVLSGQVVAEQGTPNMTVQVSAGVSYDPLGERINIPSTQNLDCSLDYNAITTAVAGAPNQKYLAVHAMFDRLLTDPRTDGASLTVYFSRAETFKFKVVQGAEAVAGAAVRPAIDGNGVLLADILLSFGTTAITNSLISTTRRMDSIAFASSPRSLRRGNAKDALGDLLGYYNLHITGGIGADKHVGADVNYAGGGTWADGTTNPATTVEAQLDKIVSDLAQLTGSKKIGGLRPIFNIDQSIDSGSGEVTTSASFVDITVVAPKSLVDVVTGDKIYIFLGLQFFPQAGVTGAYNVIIDDTVAANVVFTEVVADAGITYVKPLMLRFTAVRTATHTVKLQFKRTAGAGNFQIVPPSSFICAAIRG